MQSGTTLVEKADKALRAICSTCEEELKANGKAPEVDVGSSDRLRERQFDETFTCYRCGKSLPDTGATI